MLAMGSPDVGGGAWLRPCGVIWGPVGRALWFLLHRACLANFVIHRGPRLAAGSALPRWLLWFGAWWPAPKTSVGGDGRGLCAWHVVRTHTHPKSEEPYIDKLVGAVTGTFKEYAWFAGTREKRRLTARWSGSWQGSGLTGSARVLDSTKFQLRDASPVTAVGDRMLSPYVGLGRRFCAFEPPRTTFLFGTWHPARWTNAK